nr:DUF255 domain-containing protein [Bacillus velezensis]
MYFNTHTPVNWHPWEEEAFEKAKRENKPILVIDSMSLSFSNHYIYLLANSLIIKPNS